MAKRKAKRTGKAKTTKAQRACVTRKIGRNLREGRPFKQALAMSLRQCGVPQPKRKAKRRGLKFRLDGVDTSLLTAGQINKALDKVDKASSKLVDEFIAAGRGRELPSETMTKSDPLARKYVQLWEERSQLRAEVEHRYGPGAPQRLPRGFGAKRKRSAR
jgi:hypothetical protein